MPIIEEDKGPVRFDQVGLGDFFRLEMRGLGAKLGEINQTVGACRAGQITVDTAAEGVLFTLTAPLELYYSGQYNE